MCLRCGSQLYNHYDELKCLQCGFVEYVFPNLEKHNDAFSSSTQILRYKGKHKAMRNKVCLVQIRPIKRTMRLVPECPFCGETMAETNRSDLGRDRTERGWMCNENHTVIITSKGWR